MPKSTTTKTKRKVWADAERKRLAAGGVELPARWVDREDLVSYAVLADEIGVSVEQIRTWFHRNTDGLRDLALPNLSPPVWVRSEAVPVLAHRRPARADG